MLELLFADYCIQCIVITCCHHLYLTVNLLEAGHPNDNYGLCVIQELTTHRTCIALMKINMRNVLQQDHMVVHPVVVATFLYAIIP